MEDYNGLTMNHRFDTEALSVVTRASLAAAEREHAARLARELATIRRDRRATVARSAWAWAQRSFRVLTNERRAVRTADRFASQFGVGWAQPVPLGATKASVSLAWYAVGTFLR